MAQTQGDGIHIKGKCVSCLALKLHTPQETGLVTQIRKAQVRCRVSVESIESPPFLPHKQFHVVT